MRNEDSRSEWILAGILMGISTTGMLAVLLLIKNSIFLLFPTIGMSGSLTTAYFLLRNRDVKLFGSLGSKKRVLSMVFHILMLSALDSFSIIGIRLSETLEIALMWNAFQILFTSLILLCLMAFSVLLPRPIFEKSTNRLILSIFAFMAIFLFTVYILNIINGAYEDNISKNYGIYYEMQLSKTGFGRIYPIVKVFFTTITSLTVIFFTLQFLKIKNKSLKRYYSVLYYSIILIIIFEIAVVTILNYFFKINSISFFGITSFLFSLVLAYYILHFRDVVSEIKKLVPKKGDGKGKIIVFDDRKTDEAKENFINSIKKGYTGIIFSTEPMADFSPELKRYEDKMVYVHCSSDGYRIKDFVFRSIEDLEALDVFPGNFNGIVIYSKTLDVGTISPNEKRKESVKFYKFLFKTILRGAVLIAPMKKEILVDKEIKESENPLWLIKPLIVLRLEDALNTVYSMLDTPKKKRFLTVLLNMEKKGLPSSKTGNDYIELDLNAEIDRDTFSYLIRSIGKKLEEEGIMSREKYRSVMKKIFDTYGDDYDATVLVTKGGIYFIGEKNSREKAMKMAKCLAQFNRKTIIISRVNPRILRKKYELPRDTVFRWITNLSSSEECIMPYLENIKKEIFSFIEEKDGKVVVLDGVEYLLRLYDFEPIIEFLWIVQDRISLTEAVLLVPINPGVFEKKEIETIKRDFTFIG